MCFFTLSRHLLSRCPLEASITAHIILLLRLLIFRQKLIPRISCAFGEPTRVPLLFVREENDEAFDSELHHPLAKSQFLCHTNDEMIKVGDVISVPAEGGNVSGIVIAVEHYSAEDVSTSLDEMQWVLRK